MTQLILKAARWSSLTTAHFGRNLMTGSGSAVNKTYSRIRSTWLLCFPHLRHSISASKKPVSQIGGLTNSNLQELLPHTSYGPYWSCNSSVRRLKCLTRSRRSNSCISSQRICVCSLSLQASISLSPRRISPDLWMWCSRKGQSQLTQ